jgi:hypothetical protein
VREVLELGFKSMQIQIQAAAFVIGIIRQDQIMNLAQNHHIEASPFLSFVLVQPFLDFDRGN